MTQLTHDLPILRSRGPATRITFQPLAESCVECGALLARAKAGTFYDFSGGG